MQFFKTVAFMTMQMHRQVCEPTIRSSCRCCVDSKLMLIHCLSLLVGNFAKFGSVTDNED